MASFFGLGRNRQKSAIDLARETKDLTQRLAQDEKANLKVR
jgi:calcium binding protein 39